MDAGAGSAVGAASGAGAASGGIGGQVSAAATGGASANTPGGTGGYFEGTGGATDYCSGSGGVASTGASGGAAGAGEGGRWGLCCHEPPSCLAESLCGNGVRDACTASSGADPCPVLSFAEACDGGDLGGSTCDALGFGSGQIACSSTCQIDSRACYTCVATATAVSRCNSVTAPALSFPSIAANDDGTAVVWVEQTVGGALQVAFSLLSPRLEVVSSGHFVETFPARSQGDIPGAQVAALPSGWVVMVTFGDKISLYALDKAGGVTATNTVDSMSGGLDVSAAFIVSQPAGGPMVIWGTLDIYAAFVSADGLNVTAPRKLSVGPETVGGIPPGLTSATFAAGQFQAVVLGNCDFVRACVEIVSIAADGTSTVAFPAPGVDGPWGARLVSGADELRLYSGANCGTTDAIDPCLMYERLTAAGTVAAAPSVINHAFAGLLPNAAVALDGDSYLSFDSAVRSSTLVHASPDGTFVGDPSVIAMGGSDAAVIVRQGTNLVAAWIAEGPPVRIEVALLAP